MKHQMHEAMGAPQHFNDANDDRAEGESYAGLHEAAGEGSHA